VEHYFASRSYARVADEFRREYPDSNRFRECGSVSDRKRSGRPAILTEAKLAAFLRCKVININSKCCMSCSLCIKPANIIA
jgi:hypothetical protein